MSFVAVGVAAGGALLGAYSSHEASKQASKDSANEQSIEQGQLALANKQDARSQQLFDQYERVFAPRQEQLVEQAFEHPVSPTEAASEAGADVRSSLASARSADMRNARRLGVNLASPAYQGLEAIRGLEGAKAEVGARTTARRNTRDLNFQRQAEVVGLGNGLPGEALNAEGAAQRGFSDVGTLAGMRARRSGDLAYDTGQNYGASLTNLVDTGLSAWRNRRATTPEAEFGADYDPSFASGLS